MNQIDTPLIVTAFTPLAGLCGGILIGLSAVLLMGGLGRVAGISGIFGSLLGRWQPDSAWRLVFIVGLLAGAILTSLLGGFDSDSMAFPGNPLSTVLGGLLVGLGTAIGNGCTSGHGICGLARLSVRSMVSTAVFMFFAVATVYMMRHVIGA
ncbi:MAG: YeeE/YedE family protein [Aestuariivirga sp.]|uniref:YeeE/YedE family protein n=1 Tax=Aestuariivirga sp. TaxID=2650926 RepID=UPI0025BF0064|nr:YeeE/YedE thiosulfate transporter family protein [Aestuariivirga sp.]MCA3562002.1 YeeE/YedE family protein [Aestuariivirga sp.]